MKPAAEILGLAARTILRWRRQECGEDRRHGPLTAPANKLTIAERQEVLSVVNSQKYRGYRVGHDMDGKGKVTFEFPPRDE